MNLQELIRTRKSIRTFDGKEIFADDRKKLTDYIGTITNPYGIPIEFVMLDSAEYGLSSPVIEGEHLYIAGKVPKTEHCEEAFGYAFEKLVLYAWSLGIGTTWIGGTMKRKLFENAVQIRLRSDVEARLGHPVRDVVITVPAAFKTLQTEATNRAAKAAGFRNIILLNTFAALSGKVWRHDK